MSLFQSLTFIFCSVKERVRALKSSILPDDGDLGLVHDFLRRGLDAHVPDGRGGRPDEDDARLLAQVGKLNVLGEEAVARVDGLRAGTLCHFNDPLFL